jgi:hypothetical protein
VNPSTIAPKSLAYFIVVAKPESTPVRIFQEALNDAYKTESKNIQPEATRAGC